MEINFTLVAKYHISVKFSDQTMEFSTRHLACFMPAVQVGWNQFKPVGSSLVHMRNRNSIACCITSDLDFNKGGCVIQI